MPPPKPNCLIFKKSCIKSTAKASTFDAYESYCLLIKSNFVDILLYCCPLSKVKSTIWNLCTINHNIVLEDREWNWYFHFWNVCKNAVHCDQNNSFEITINGNQVRKTKEIRNVIFGLCYGKPFSALRPKLGCSLSWVLDEIRKFWGKPSLNNKDPWP